MLTKSDLNSKIKTAIRIDLDLLFLYLFLSLILILVLLRLDFPECLSTRVSVKLHLTLIGALL